MGEEERREDREEEYEEEEEEEREKNPKIIYDNSESEQGKSPTRNNFNPLVPRKGTKIRYP